MTGFYFAKLLISALDLQSFIAPLKNTNVYLRISVNSTVSRVLSSRYESFSAARAFVDLAFPAGLSRGLAWSVRFSSSIQREKRELKAEREIFQRSGQPILRDSDSTLQDQLTGIRSLQMHQGHKAAAPQPNQISPRIPELLLLAPLFYYTAAAPRKKL